MKNKSENSMIITDFNVKINRDAVLDSIDLKKNSPNYEEILEEYMIMEKEINSLIDPTVIIQFDYYDSDLNIDNLKAGIPVIYVLLTIGNKISERTSQLFQKGDYLRGMMLDALADNYLFQMDGAVQSIIRNECELRNLGISERFEAPGNIPMEAQKIILDKTGADKILGMDITSGYMFTIIKTFGFILALTEDSSVHNMQHDCSQCSAANCKMRANRPVRLTIIRGKEEVELDCMKNESILSAMVRNGIYISAACGGKGTCGKCKIQMKEGSLDITDYDRKKLSQKELDAGIRLACKLFPKEDCRIRLVTGDESDFEIISDYDNELTDQDKTQKMIEEEGYIIGIDIGTTTIAFHLVGITSKQIIHTFTTINRQRAFGADVISRITASNAGKKVQLRESIQKNLQEGMREIIEGAEIDKTRVKTISIAGNTTMGHLLMGYSCETLGIYPYTPVNIGRIEKGYEEIIGNDYLNIPVILLPGISTYVGGDIVSGLLSCDFDKKDEVCMLIDLGTNGEMAIGNRERILVCSTAAGPAFEGGNITNGVGSIAGAISNVSIIDGKVRYKTIADAPPVGICGTGVIEMTSELLRNGLIDETGLLDDEYFDDGYELAKDPEGNCIAMTQKDIREIQLAKAAVSAGVKTLITRYGVGYDKIGRVYIAGGFGYKIDIDKAIHIGLLAEEFEGKTKAIGNSSLSGAVKYLTIPDATDRVDKILSVSEEINLSNDKTFNEFYIENMFFCE